QKAVDSYLPFIVRPQNKKHKKQGGNKKTKNPLQQKEKRSVSSLILRNKNTEFKNCTERASAQSAKKHN
ncbi:hypothetical protein, partial [Treponema berlinense]|uniref:hypothetical protein n=1 Tax=Treponema berlinense TaxID=225004 RepID=UPI003F12116F